MGWFKNRFLKEGAGRAAPASGWSRCGSMGLTHFWKLVRVNLLFLLFSLPVVTLPAALTALDRVCVLIYKDGNVFLWDEFWKEFRRSLLRALVPGLCFGILLYGGYFFLSLGNGNFGSLYGIVFWCLGLIMVAAAVIWGEYFFVLISILDIDNRRALKNALILWLAKPGYALLSLFITLVLFFVDLALLPMITPFLVALIGIVLAQYPICYMIYDVTEDMILIPYEKSRQEEASDSHEVFLESEKNTR